MSVDFRVELMRQSNFFIALKCGMSRKQWKCIPYFIFWTALLSFGEGIAQGVTLFWYNFTLSEKLHKEYKELLCTLYLHSPFVYILLHLLYNLFSPPFLPFPPCLPCSLSSSPSFHSLIYSSTLSLSHQHFRASTVNLALVWVPGRQRWDRPSAPKAVPGSGAD